jgi:hypothetical protein
VNGWPPQIAREKLDNSGLALTAALARGGLQIPAQRGDATIKRLSRIVDHLLIVVVVQRPLMNVS